MPLFTSYVLVRCGILKKRLQTQVTHTHTDLGMPGISGILISGISILGISGIPGTPPLQHRAKKGARKASQTSRRKCNKAAGATLPLKCTPRNQRGVTMQATTRPCKTTTQGLATTCQNASHSIKFIMIKHGSQIKQGGVHIHILRRLE
jgi:hypothetical protein